MATPKQGYRNAAGEKLPSVTTIIGRFKDGGGLTQWAYKQGRRHENLSMRNLPSPAHLYDVTGEAAQAGTIAHHLIERHVLTGAGLEAGAIDLPPEAIEAEPDVKKNAMNAFAQYLEWRELTRIEIIGTELGLVSERYQFGGTLDAVGRDAKGRVILLDWKTSNAIYPDYTIQLAAYALLLEERKPEWTPQAYHLLRVAKKNAAFAHHFYGELEIEKRQFIRYREAYADDELIRARV